MKALRTIIIVFTLLVLSLTIFADISLARSGCCSHHGGVVGCGCGDGTPLSDTCAPYYPQCSGGGAATVQEEAPVYIPPTRAPRIIYYSPTPAPMNTIAPTPTTKPTKKVTKKKAKKVIKKQPAKKKTFLNIFGL